MSAVSICVKLINHVVQTFYVLIFFVCFCSVIEGKKRSSPTMIMDLSVSPCNSITFVFHILSAYTNLELCLPCELNSLLL